MSEIKAIAPHVLSDIIKTLYLVTSLSLYTGPYLAAIRSNKLFRDSWSCTQPSVDDAKESALFVIVNDLKVFALRQMYLMLVLKNKGVLPASWKFFISCFKLICWTKNEKYFSLRFY